MNVFKEMGFSIGKPAIYPEFLKNKKGKIFGYGMLLNEARYSQNRTVERETLRALVCKGICKEADEIDLL